MWGRVGDLEGVCAALAMGEGLENVDSGFLDGRVRLRVDVFGFGRAMRRSYVADVER